jgi:hypothetical protein
VFIPAITKQACRSRDPTGDQDHLPIQTAIVEPVRCRPPVAAIIKDLSPRIESPRNALPIDQAKDSSSKIIT